jgi:hypothetical protein
MEELAVHRLERGDVDPETECQARDGNLVPGQWVVRCPECGTCTHVNCWIDNKDRCPRQGCGGAGKVRVPADDALIVITEEDLVAEAVVTILPGDLPDTAIDIRPEDLPPSRLGS